jgi:hypothetical protein
LVLLDEPFAAVDPEFRASLREEFREILRDQGVSAVHVTHDPEEALAVGDRIGLLREGRLIQLGSAEAVIGHPVDVSAARFLGYQILPGSGGMTAVLPRELRESDADAGGGWHGQVTSVRRALGEWRIGVRLSGGRVVEWRRPASEEPGPVGRAVTLTARQAVPFPRDAGGSESAAPKVE